MLKNLESKYSPIFAYDYEPKPCSFEALNPIVNAKIYERSRGDKELENTSIGSFYLPLNKKEVKVEELKLNLVEDEEKVTIESEKFKMLNESMFSEFMVPRK